MRADGETLDGESLGEDGAFLRTLVESTSVGLLAIDPNGEIVFANPAVERILGYEPAALLGRPTTTLVPERRRRGRRGDGAARTEGMRGFDVSCGTDEGSGSDGSSRAEATSGTGLDPAFDPDATPGASAEVERTLLHRDGREVTVAVALEERRDAGERLVVATVAGGSTGRRRRERRLRERKRELEEFADVLSHDLQGPLTVARTRAERARERGDREELRGVEEALDRMEQLIDEMLAHTRYGEGVGTMEVMPLRPVTRAAWDSVLTCDAELVPPDGEWRIRAHRGRLRQLTENLVRNAVEHAGPGATVRVGVLEDEGGFYVEDDGPGLPDAVREGLGSSDRRARIEACGYGLRIVETIAREHGWSLRPAKSRTGGARFEFDGATVFRG